MTDVLKVLKDLEYKAVGVDPENKKMPEGYFVSFRPIGLPIPEEDFRNPWTPTGSNLKEILSSMPKPGSTPGTAVTDAGTTTPVSASAQLDKNQFIAAGIGESMQSFLNTFMLTDDKLVMSNDYRTMPGSGKVNDAWYAIINGANGIPSDMELSDEIKKALDAAKAILMDKDGNPTPHYESYAKYEEEYRDAVKSRDKQYANALSDPMKLQMWPIQGKIYQDEVEEAWDKWQGFGFKVEIEKAVAILAAQGVDPAILLIARAKHKYENSLINIPNIGNIPYTFMLPRKWYSATGGGWNSYSESDFHNEVHFNSSSSRTSAGGGLNLGFFTIGGQGSVNTQRTNLDIKTTNLSIKFEYTVVDIKRPWLDTTLMNLSNWFLVGDYPASCISDGTFGQELRVNNPTEMLFLPSIVTSLLLVRNLNIRFDGASTHSDTFSKTVEGGGFIGYGPFAICASHSSKKKSSNFSFDSDGQGITVEGVQLIGAVSVINPASPKKASKDYMKKKEKTSATTPAPRPVPEPVP
ncbi:MAG: hypothetical protein WAU15_07645 [Nitrosomonas sp.]